MDLSDGEPTMLVCHHDPARRALAAAAGEAMGLRNVGEVTMFPEVLAMADLVDPSVLLLDRRAAGVDGSSSIEELVRAHPMAAVVVITDELSTADTLMAAGAAAVALDGDRAALDAAIERALICLGAEKGAGSGRRSRQDRRKQQDWSKVTSERRGGEDRRLDPDRRDPQRAPPASGEPSGGKS